MSNTQMELQKIAQAKNDRAAHLFTEQLSSELFPNDRLSKNWRYLAAKAICKSAPMSHRLSLNEFKRAAIADPEKDELTLFQFGVLSNSIESVSRFDLSLNREEYCNFLGEAVEHIVYYNKRVVEMRKEIEMQVETEFQMKTAKEKGLTMAKA
jgi:hypothetical protein